MREKLAILFCAVTVSVVLALSWAFAARHNRDEPLTRVAAHPGKALFEKSGCATCHSFGGVGNPRLPLEGAGARLSESELRAWITGVGNATNKLSLTIQKRKQRYRTMAEEEMRVLIDYLQIGAK